MRYCVRLERIPCLGKLFLFFLNLFYVIVDTITDVFIFSLFDLHHLTSSPPQTFTTGRTGQVCLRKGVAGRMTPPKVAYILTAKTCDCSVPSPWRVKVADGMEAANQLTLEQGHPPGPWRQPQCNPKTLHGRRGKQV